MLEHVAAAKRQRELGARILVRAEHEATVRILERGAQRRDHARGRGRDLALLDPEQPQLLRVRSRAPLDRCRALGIDARLPRSAADADGRRCRRAPPRGPAQTNSRRAGSRAGALTSLERPCSLSNGSASCGSASGRRRRLRSRRRAYRRGCGAPSISRGAATSARRRSTGSSASGSAGSSRRRRPRRRGLQRGRACPKASSAESRASAPAVTAAAARRDADDRARVSPPRTAAARARRAPRSRSARRTKSREPLRFLIGERRREQQVLAAVGRDALEPVQRLLVVRRRIAAEAERDHGVELETLRAVHRHDLDAAGRAADRLAAAVPRARPRAAPGRRDRRVVPRARAARRTARRCASRRRDRGTPGPSSACQVRSTQRANEVSARAANAASRRARVASRRARPSALSARSRAGSRMRSQTARRARVVTERMQDRPT